MHLYKQREIYMNFGTWNMRSLNWSGTHKTLDRELAAFRSFIGNTGSFNGQGNH
jgi:hypothetical protein